MLLNIENPPKVFDLDIALAVISLGSNAMPLATVAQRLYFVFPCLVCMTSYLESMLSLSLQPRDSQYKPNHNTLPCSHMLCSGLDLPQRRPCLDPQDQCDYEIGYSDHGSSLGALVTDEFPLRLENGSTTHPHLTFGFSFFFSPT